jgi:hypothetical protein
MKNKIKLSLVTSLLILGSLSFPTALLANNQEPILIQIYDTDIGTEAFEQLVNYGNGGHAALGAILGDAQNMQQNPGIGLGIGSGGLGYRPSVTIAVWTDAVFDKSLGLATIKSYFNVPSSPVTTNGDCAIACDGTVQQPEPVQQIVETVVQQPVLIQQPEPQEQASAPQILLDNTPQHIEPTVSLEPLSSYVAPVVLTLQSSISNKVVSDKKVINKKKIITKKVARHATSKAVKRHP